MRKAGRRPQDVPPYIVPLSIQAIEVVRFLLDEVKPAQRYLLAHRSDPKKPISENTLNGALRRMGYEDRLTGHGIRGTISTALNEIGFPKVWVDAQLSHADPDKVSAAYNHAMYVEPRRHMMQDWADRLDMLEQGQVQAASTHLTIRIDGIPAGKDGECVSAAVSTQPAECDQNTGLGTPIVAKAGEGDQPIQRLSPLPPFPEPITAPEISDIHRARQEMLAVYEAPQNLPVTLFAKLAGKSRDQVNRELKAGKLLALRMGNRGQRVPDWQLDPIKNKLTQTVLGLVGCDNAWRLYSALTQPLQQLDGMAPIDRVTPDNLHAVAEIVISNVV
jgi:hypothetical protein